MDSSKLPPKKAILIDDEVHVRSVMSSALRSLGFEIVAQLSSAKEAPGRVKSSEVSLILLDVNMPGVTGAEVVEQLTRENNVCVIMLTAVKDPEVIGKCLKAGAAHYILKDSRLSEITKLIQTTWENFYAQ